jgi:hypothetical protein
MVHKATKIVETGKKKDTCKCEIERQSQSSAQGSVLFPFKEQRDMAGTG